MKSLKNICILASLVLAFPSMAQDARARYEIDAKRMGINYDNQEALYSSREFIRLDSTYYVGWMVEGIYRSNKASDHLGYTMAIPALKKALFLMEKDFAKDLKAFASSSAEGVYSYNPTYFDLMAICQALKEDYENIEVADSLMWVIDKFESYKFPGDPLRFKTAKAWTYHRNRFFTNSKFAFLGNNIEENEKKALQYCYEAMGAINPQFETFGLSSERLSAYFYLAIIHNYLKNYDSAAFYYKELEQNGYVSYNNYGLFEHEIGNFARAKEYITMSLGTHYRSLEEPAYWIPMLEVYAGRTKQAISLIKLQISHNGSTPGFGWYNLGLARSYMYDGQLDSSEIALEKAAGFRELHIGTTLSQVQYDFTINLLRLQLIDKKIAQIKFTNSGWWYSPSSIMKIARLKIEKFLLEYILVNQMINNPERDRSVYDLFCNESTTSFDEAYYLLREFSLPYFTQKYKDYPKKDKRQNIHRYFKLMEARLEWDDGNERTAQSKFQEIQKEALVDTAQEKLFRARLYEGLAKCHEEKGNDKNLALYTNAAFEEYPQLLPFSGITPRMRLNYSGVSDKATKRAISELKDCEIKWKNEPGIPVANISFTKKNNRYEVLINVNSASGKPVVTQQRIIFKDSDKGVGKEIALRMFGKGGALNYENNF